MFIHAQCEVAANLAADGLAGAGRCGHDDGLAVVQRAQRVDLEVVERKREAVGQQVERRRAGGGARLELADDGRCAGDGGNGGAGGSDGAECGRRSAQRHEEQRDQPP